MSFKNKKIAFVFPGQGSQYIGMGLDLYENNPAYKTIFENLHKRIGCDLLDIMKNGPEETLKDTKFTQPAILAHSIMALQSFLHEIKIEPDFVAGHSLGEFSALVANGVLDFADALYLVHKRGEYMIKANDGNSFAMSAVLGLDSDTIIEICQEASKMHPVVAANFNTPIQTVISGSREGVEIAGNLAKAKNAKRVLPLAVGGPFHSPLIKNAAIWLADEMDKIDFHDAKCPVISNVYATGETNAERIVKNLETQVTSPVLWVDTIKYLSSQGVEIFVEFGPQKVLSGMITKIIDNATVYNIDKYSDIAQVKEHFENL